MHPLCVGDVICYKTPLLNDHKSATIKEINPNDMYSPLILSNGFFVIPSGLGPLVFRKKILINGYLIKNPYIFYQTIEQYNLSSAIRPKLYKKSVSFKKLKKYNDGFLFYGS